MEKKILLFPQTINCLGITTEAQLKLLLFTDTQPGPARMSDLWSGINQFPQGLRTDSYEHGYKPNEKVPFIHLRELLKL